MKSNSTALILIGFQNDYFSPDGALHAVVEKHVVEYGILAKSVALIERLVDSPVTLICTPILFSPDYSEIPSPQGLMATIRDLGAFRRGTPGGAIIDELNAFGDRIISVTGKTGFNAFHGTRLEDILAQKGITDVVLLGVVTSICIDSTGRAASELGLQVTMLSDCIAGRSLAEHEFYCRDIFPLYGNVTTSTELLAALEV